MTYIYKRLEEFEYFEGGKIVSGLYSLHELGQSVWYDNIERGMIQSGEIKRLINLGVTGVTSNPSIFERAVTQSNVYDESLVEGWNRGLDSEGLYRELVLQDIQNTADALHPVYQASNGQDGYVSVEVSPELAYDSEATIADAVRWWESVNRPNVMIKVPATSEGIDATRKLVRKGISVNVTLVFGLQQYFQVMNAYLDGLRARQSDGQELKSVTSVASFFVSRVDDEVDKRIIAEQLDKRFLGTAAIANAKLAYAQFRNFFSSGNFASLRQQGANVQRILWASTGPKNPAYPYLLYVRSLIGKDSVNTMPPHILNLTIKQHNYKLTLEDSSQDARDAIETFKLLGIDTEEIGEQLLIGGVEAFINSYQNLLKNIERKAQRISFK